MWRLLSGASDRRVCYHAAAISLMPPTPIRLVPGLLRARGLKVSLDILMRHRQPKGWAWSVIARVSCILPFVSLDRAKCSTSGCWIDAVFP
jgi:hypothetical protein